MVYYFDIDTAKEYGVNEAIMIANFQHWIAKNKTSKDHQYEGRTWTYNSKKAFMELFPFWGEQTIKTTINHLKDKGVLITGNYNKNPYDHTLWYAFVDENKWLKSIQTIDKLELTNQSVEIGQPIPDNKPNIKQEKDIINNINIISNIQKEIPKKEKYGEFGNVVLTKDEYSKLETKYGNQIERAISILDDYLEYKGKRYKSHYAVMKEGGWVWNETFSDHSKPQPKTKTRLF